MWVHNRADPLKKDRGNDLLTDRHEQRAWPNSSDTEGKTTHKLKYELFSDEMLNH